MITAGTFYVFIIPLFSILLREFPQILTHALDQIALKKGVNDKVFVLCDCLLGYWMYSTVSHFLHFGGGDVSHYVLL